MDVNRLIGQAYRLEHLHSDGRWEPMRPRDHHDPSEHDPERGWSGGQLFVCPRCDEQVRVVPDRVDGHEER